MSVATNEDAIITAIQALGLFGTVASLGRRGEPEIISYPAALVYFSGDGDANGLRTAEYHIQVRAYNLASEGGAAQDVYSLLDAVRTAIHHRQIFSADPPARCAGRELSGWDEAESIIEYTLKFQIVQTLTIGM